MAGSRGTGDSGFGKEANQMRLLLFHLLFQSSLFTKGMETGYQETSGGSSPRPAPAPADGKVTASRSRSGRDAG